MVRLVWIVALALVLDTFQAPVLATTCSKLYGLPSFQACHNLLYENPGIGHFDTRDHGFILPLTPKPTWWTPWQWENRRYVPEMWSNSGTVLSIHKSLIFTDVSCFSDVGGCKIALVPILLADGSIGTDTSTWSAIAVEAIRILPVCSRMMSGGFQFIGMR